MDVPDLRGRGTLEVAGFGLCLVDTMGGGVCPLNFCGQVKAVAALASGGGAP